MNARQRDSLRTAVIVAVIALGCLWLLFGNGGTGGDSTTFTPAGSVAAVETVGFPTHPDWDGDSIDLVELPEEAIDTIGLIADGGPFPYRQDDGVFQNRERRLPSESRSYYREYTVETPGSRDRGARRIVTGADGEMYWTADHYDSFDVIRHDS